jgi:hypothetical protein
MKMMMMMMDRIMLRYLLFLTIDQVTPIYVLYCLAFPQSPVYRALGYVTGCKADGT